MVRIFLIFGFFRKGFQTGHKILLSNGSLSMFNLIFHIVCEPIRLVLKFSISDLKSTHAFTKPKVVLFTIKANIFIETDLSIYCNL